jgi:hypothetical protein
VNAFVETRLIERNVRKRRGVGPLLGPPDAERSPRINRRAGQRLRAHRQLSISVDVREPRGFQECYFDLGGSDEVTEVSIGNGVKVSETVETLQCKYWLYSVKSRISRKLRMGGDVQQHWCW